MRPEDAPVDGTDLGNTDVSEVRDLPDRLLKITEVCHRAGLSQAMIYRLIKRQRFPAPYKLSPSMARWSEKELLAWIAEIKGGVEGKLRKFW